MERTLLLSSHYEPMMTISWRKAIVLMTLGKVEILEEYDREVRSTSIVVRLPAVVRLINRFRRLKHRVRYSKHNLFARDRWTCQYCGRRKPIQHLTQDHVIPKAQGGKTGWDNVVTSCITCNAKKAGRTPEQARMALRARPYRPETVPLFMFRLGRDAPEAWRLYCYFLDDTESTK
jgi:5-methylcytosine-specific restriction endonuclease McrA